MVEIISNHPEKTKELGAHIAREASVFKKEGKLTDTACIIGLVGDLGAGKTTFMQGFAYELGITDRVLSPTFLLLKRFDIPKETPSGRKHHRRSLYHIDAYRLADHGGARELGVEELMKDSTNLIVIEWADRFKKILPEHTIWISFEWLGNEKRKVTIDHNPLL